MEERTSIKLLLEQIKEDILFNNPRADVDMAEFVGKSKANVDMAKSFLEWSFEKTLDNLIADARELGMIEVYQMLRSSRDTKSK